MTAPDLEYVALVVDQPARSAEFFARDLELPSVKVKLGTHDVPAVAVGRTALAFFAPQDPFVNCTTHSGVHHIAIAAEQPGQRARELGLPIDFENEGLNGRAQVELSADATSGVRTRLTEPLALADGLSASIERIDHLGVASSDNHLARKAFVDTLGCVYESQQTDSEFESLAENFTSDRYPNVFHTRPARLSGSLRVLFVTVGDCEMEFLQDLTATVATDTARHDRAGDTRGDRSAIARYVNRRGPGLHHLALKTPNIDQLLTRLGSAGHRMIDTVGRPGSRRARIGFVHPVATGGVLLHFVEREEI
jgi:methylmalonyl-CoA epimerase